MSAPTVTVYSKPACVACMATKRKLTKLEIPHTVIDVTEDPEAYAYVKSLGYSSMPVVVAELPDGTRYWSDFRDELLTDLGRELDAIAYLEADEATP